MTKKIKMGDKPLTYEEFLARKSFWEKLNDKAFDLIPCWLYRFYYDYLRPKGLKNKLYDLYQRLTRGFDDSELWNLDITFYQWFLPRFKAYLKISEGITEDDDWHKECHEQLAKLEAILLDDDNESFEDYDKNRKEFNEWFGKNLNRLWN